VADKECIVLNENQKGNNMIDDAWLLWFLIAVGFFLLEFAAPGVVLLFFSLGSLVTMLTSLLGLTNSLTSQLIVCVVSSVILLLLLRSTIARWFEGDAKDGNLENEFVGHYVKVTEVIPGGDAPGKVEHKGAGWNAIADKEISVGEMVEITEINGLTFTVK